MAIPLVALATLASTAYGMYKSNQQNKEARAINDRRPRYNIPSEIGQIENTYQRLANSSRMPGQAFDESNIEEGVANSVYNINKIGGTTGDRLNAISAVNSNRNNAMNEIAARAQQYRYDNIDKLALARKELANYKDQAFDYNYNQPFLYNRNRKNMLKDASNQNMMNSLNAFGNIATQAYAVNEQNKI